MEDIFLFITLEGIEGCGKSTQIRILAETLRKTGRHVVVTREPGGCPISDAIRSVLLDSANKGMTPVAELLLYAAARAQHVEDVIRPALAEGKIVLCDRFSDATFAYQGGGRGLDTGLIRRLNNIATGGLAPDLTLLLDFSPEEGLKRARTRNSKNSGPDEGRFESESLDFHGRVRKGYLDLARTENRFLVIEASGTIEEVASRMAKAVISRIGKRNS